MAWLGLCTNYQSLSQLQRFEYREKSVKHGVNFKHFNESAAFICTIKSDVLLLIISEHSSLRLQVYNLTGQAANTSRLLC